MEKIYVVTQGDYSDYHIIACFTDKEKAELCAKIYSDYYDEAGVEEYDIKDNDFIWNDKQCTLTAEVDITNLFKNITDSPYCTIEGPINAESVKDCVEWTKFTREYIKVNNYYDGGCIIKIKKNYAYDRFTDETAKEYFQKFIQDLIAKVKSYILDGANGYKLEELIVYKGE